MATPLDPKEIATVQEIAIFCMLEIEALRQLLFEKVDREMKEKGAR